jgi:hypothetical protein
MSTRLHFLLPLALCCLGASAQEGSGQAEIGFQQYYLAVGSSRVANISGLGFTYSQAIPNVGLFTGSVVPALNNNRFGAGDNYVGLQGLPFAGQYWTFTAGDFHVPGQLLRASFTNITYPEIAARGAMIEAAHAGRTLGVFYGEETIANTPRVVLRMQAPQKIAGFYFRQKIGDRLLLGARLLHFSNDLAGLRSMPGLLTQSSFTNATTLSVNSLYTVAGSLKLYGEATWSVAGQEKSYSGAKSVPFSIVAGPIWESQAFTVRANYVSQSSAYFPLLGYYLGDRAGPFGELKYRPFSRVEIYGSASGYRNNVGNDPRLGTFRSTSESAGVSLQLPSRISVTANLLFLNLTTRPDSATPWAKSTDQQRSITASRSFAHQSLQFTVREFRDASPATFQRQRSGEIEDHIHLRHLTIGGGARIQRMTANPSRTTVFYRGSAQFQHGRFSAYANFEAGNDLQNRTLFATNTISTTVFGASVRIGKSWEFQAEAYRNNLVTELNPQSIFVLQGQGVYVPGTLAALNQWSTYFRLTRRIHWGKAVAVDLSQYSAVLTPLKGSIEGFVKERISGGDQPAEGVTVTIDQGRAAMTDANGRYRFAEVPEGPHKVALALHELPAEFEAGKIIESAFMVLPAKTARADLEVIRLALIQGTVRGPKDESLEKIIVRIAGTDRYTTPNAKGNFYFYNMREGDYTLTLDEKTLPQLAVLRGSETASVAVRIGVQPAMVVLQFETSKPEKTVRQIVIDHPAPAPISPVETARQGNAQAAQAALQTPDAVPVPKAAANTSAVPPAVMEQVSPDGAGSAAAQKYNAIGRQLTQAGQYRKAIDSLNQAIAADPKFALAYNARGFAWFKLQAYKQALDDLNTAIRIDPGYINAYQIRALVRKAMGDSAGAAADLERARDLQRHTPPGHSPRVP